MRCGAPTMNDSAVRIGFRNNSDSRIEQLRVPPHSIEAEQAVLGALMIESNAFDRIADLLTDNDFYRRDHQLIFRAIRELAEQRQPYEAVTLGEWFESKGLAEQVSGGAYLVELASTTPSAANITAYAEIVRDKAVLRQLIEVGTNIVNDSFQPEGREVSELFGHAVSNLQGVGAKIQTGQREPLDMFGDYELPALKPEYLPPGLARYANDRASIMGTAPEIIAMSAITTAAAAIHDRIVIQPKPNEAEWTESARLWCMVVATPGSKKSAAQKLATKPLRKINNEISYGYAAKITEYEKAMQLIRMKEKKAMRKEANGEAALGYDEPADAPERPPNHLAIIQDGTSAAVCDALCDNERGMLWYVDELVVWFGLHEAFKDGGMSRGIALQAYEGGSYRQMRVGRGMVNVPNLSYSVLGSTQPEKIRALMGKSADDGLMQRFMVIEVPQKVFPDEEDREIDHAATRQYEETIKNMWALQPPDGGLSVVRLSPEANTIRTEFWAWIKKMANNSALPSMLRGHLAKWEGLWPRLALTYHCYGCTSLGKHPTQVTVNIATAKRVTDLMKNYLFPQALRFYRDTLSESDEVYRAAKLASAMILAEQMPSITNRQLHHGVNAWRNMPDFKKQSVISLLTEAGWLIAAEKEKSSWAVNPRVHALYAQRAAVEKARRAETAQTLAELRDLKI